MPHILQNKNLEIHIDLPDENYKASRFDRTGKIVKVKFHNVLLSSVERTDRENEDHFGKGFYNEFGIDTALGFDEAETGGWFHKIGVGLLKKDDDQYLFSKNYQIKPAEFTVITEPDRILINCSSESVNGYSYVLKKEIQLYESKFRIKYYLQNTGEKDIVTNEYSHNFIAINKDRIGDNYVLKFPFQLKPKRFEETVNPERKVDIGQNEMKFNDTPKEQFFFSNLSGSKTIDAAWELINLSAKVGIRETGNFQTNKVNLWGWKHVISPELFIDLHIKPGQSAEWFRTYHVYKV